MIGPSVTSREARANERAITGQVESIVDGGRANTLRTVLYALYVAALLLLTYGVTLSHAFFSTQDPPWLREQVVSWRGLMVLVLLVAVGVIVAARAGRVRGPVVPPVPWIDLVLPGPLDRALTLRRWWLIASVLVVTGAAMVGAVVGGGAWFAQVGEPLWLLTGAVLATGIGIVLLLVWFGGQVLVSSPGRVPPVWSPRRALRLLRREELRTQSARSTRMGGAVLLGDLRALRLETVPPVTRGRSRRLRPGPAWAAVPRRDLLGTIRQPGSVLVAISLTVVAAAALAWALVHPAVPVIVPAAAGLLLHLGCSAAAEGLRLQGDNAGTPPLLGFSARGEALGHLVLPVVVCGAVAKATAALVGWLGGVSGAYLLGMVAWVALMVVLAIGTTIASAFRGGAPLQAFLPETGPVMMLSWTGRHALTAMFAVAGLTALLGRGEPLAWVAAALAAAAALWRGVRRVDAVTLEHRD